MSAISLSTTKLAKQVVTSIKYVKLIGSNMALASCSGFGSIRSTWPATLTWQLLFVRVEIAFGSPLISLHDVTTLPIDHCLGLESEFGRKGCFSRCHNSSTALYEYSSHRGVNSTMSFADREHKFGWHNQGGSIETSIGTAPVFF